MIDTWGSIARIAVIAAVTVVLRFLPFWVFKPGHKVPEWIEYLGKVLPYSIVGMLVIYCLRNISLLKAPFGAPELIACAVTAGLHIWKKNMLLSVGLGTICYMILIRVIQV